ncbi:hypothetical protein ANCDUO_05903 [Ancylostoma duodenale]|uniref:Uncharacterized protein n=1 Tax=Ancylostoma duodenale TaxID=51022 RepID=A0A0C2DME3_9BILA|nr:hypothetical protein ANCDUO_05903 [Ancylostoma duodenale]
MWNKENTGADKSTVDKFVDRGQGGEFVVVPKEVDEAINEQHLKDVNNVSNDSAMQTVFELLNKYYENINMHALSTAHAARLDGVGEALESFVVALQALQPVVHRSHLRAHRCKLRQDPLQQNGLVVGGVEADVVELVHVFTEI